MVVSRVAAGRSVPAIGNGSAGIPFPPNGGLTRVVISNIRPAVDGGRKPSKTTARRPAKAAVGQLLRVEADAFSDGHDELFCELRYRCGSDAKWSSMPMVSLGDDRWRADWPITGVGFHRFAIRAWVDRFATWRRDLAACIEAGQDVSVELVVGAGLVRDAAARASGQNRSRLLVVAEALMSGKRGLESPVPPGDWRGGSLGDVIFSDDLSALVVAAADPATATTSSAFPVFADPEQARHSAWYELFPRSATPNPERHGTLEDVRHRLDDIEGMGFDVIYLPPIHPIGLTGRKGPDGAPVAGPDDPGSPWAIGSAAGGHREIHPELGTVEDFSALVAEASDRGINIAIDLAFQASPDHPWVREHPQWFRHRPDGTIRHAENPPKVYQDIYPIDFETSDWQALWTELLDVVLVWIERGVRHFRVDNPHTKPFAFWEWLIRSVKERYPEVIFLAEAFTRPAVMKELAKLGFTQSYTYFTWRNTKWELETYLRELTEGEMADYFRPSFWPNTPDILTEELQSGGRPAFVSRLILAATLSPNYGIYGPAFELQEHVPRWPGSEEYRRSEKYEIRAWDLGRPDSLTGLVGLVNAIRRAHPALQHQEGLRFQGAENDQIIAYTRRHLPLASDTHEGADLLLVVVNLDHEHEQSAWIDLDLGSIGLDPARPFVMHDLLSDAHYQWLGPRNFVILDPAQPAHIFAVSQFTGSEAS
jgi:starch synthase (maltosyl-transferring)